MAQIKLFHLQVHMTYKKRINESAPRARCILTTTTWSQSSIDGWRRILQLWTATGTGFVPAMGFGETNFEIPKSRNPDCLFELGDYVVSIFGVLRQWMDSSAVCLSIGLGFAFMIWPNSDHAKMSALSFPPIWHQSCSLDANSIRACCLRKQNTLGGGPRPSAFVLLLRCHSGDLSPLYPSSSPLRSSPKTNWLHRRWPP